MIRVPDNLENHVYYMHSNGIVEMGVHVVMFGYRIRAGYVGDWYVPIDYCCGDKQSDIEEIYSMVLHILKNQETINFEAFPTFHTKPILNDKECISRLRAMSEGMEKIKIPPVQIYRYITFSKISPL